MAEFTYLNTSKTLEELEWYKKSLLVKLHQCEESRKTYDNWSYAKELRKVNLLIFRYSKLPQNHEQSRLH